MVGYEIIIKARKCIVRMVLLKLKRINKIKIKGLNLTLIKNEIIQIRNE
jgi:hypothetical protein